VRRDLQSGTCGDLSTGNVRQLLTPALTPSPSPCPPPFHPPSLQPPTTQPTPRTPNPGGLGLRRDISMDEVKQHNTAEDAWMVLSGRVYNITPYMPFHPGGAEILARAAGKDGTALFQRYHPWVNGHALLEACLLGAIKVSRWCGGGSFGGGGCGCGLSPQPQLFVEPLKCWVAPRV